MEYIAAKNGEQVFYIEESRVAAILQEPKIYKIPGADENIEGLSLYEGRLVVYFRIGKKKASHCGIILNAGNGRLYAVAADNVMMQQQDEGLLTPIMTGIWGMNCD